MNKFSLYFSHIDRQKSVGAAPISIGSDKQKNVIHFRSIPPEHSVLYVRDGELIMQFVDSTAKCWINDKEVTDYNGIVRLKINDKVAIRDPKKPTFTVEKFDEKTKRKSIAPQDLQTPLKPNENPKFTAANDDQFSDRKPSQIKKEEEKNPKPISLDLNKGLKPNPEETTKASIKKHLKMDFPQYSDEEPENNHKTITKTEQNNPKNLPKKEIISKPRPVEEDIESSSSSQEKTTTKNPPPKVLPKKEIITKSPVDESETSSSSHDEKTTTKNPPLKVLPKKEITKSPVEESESSSSSHGKKTTKNPPPKVLPKKEIIEEKNSKFNSYDSVDKITAITKKLNISSSSSEESPKYPKKLLKKEITETKFVKENPTHDSKKPKPEIEKKKILQEIVPPQRRERSPEESPVKTRAKKRVLPARKAKQPSVKSKYDFLSNSESSSENEEIEESDNENRRSGGDSEVSEPEEVPYAFLASLRSNNKEIKKIPYKEEDLKPQNSNKDQKEDRLRRHVRYNVPILKKGGYEQLDYYKGKKYI